MDLFIHTANVLFLLSYLVRDILWLRLLTIVAIVTLIPYYAANDLVPPIIWNTAFAGINVFQVYRLLLERRPVKLTLEQQRLYRLGFERLGPRDFLRLVELGSWQRHDDADVLVKHGEQLQRLTVIAEGEARVVVDGETVSTLGAGQFVGEMSFVTGEPACARVVAGDCRCVHWPRDGLRKLLGERPEVRAALQDVIGTDLASKLRRGAKTEPAAASAQPAPA